MSRYVHLIHVVVGIVFNNIGQLLIAQRPAKSYGGGLWEFPGGKLEPGEQAFAALQREFLEEIGIHIVSANPWIQIKHNYHDRIVLLDTWLVQHYSGEPYGAEGQVIRWIKPKEFDQYQFPAGNTEIIKKLLQIDF